MRHKNVLLGMSGGTDSSVSAMLLIKQGYQVHGLTLRTWSQTDPETCESEPAYILKARQLAQTLNIPHTVIDVRNAFYNEVITYFVNGYLSGQTPNPCAYCNPIIKWKVLADQAEILNCQHIATGHYVDIGWFQNHAYILKGQDPDKEQSFFLWGLSQNILQKAIFPLARLSKKEVKQIAMQHGFPQVAAQKESIGICFIDQMDYRPFLNQLLNEKGIEVGKGRFEDENGTFLGWHNGFTNFTVGQRRGLGLSPNIPWYVTRIDPQSNIVYLGHHQQLFTRSFNAINYKVINHEDFKNDVDVRVRYRKQNAQGKVTFIDQNRLHIELIEPEWSIAPGQTVAFYQNNRLLGGGFIDY